MADHWVAELFPPTFEFSFQDLVRKTPQPEKQERITSQDEELKKKYDLYEKVFTELDDKMADEENCLLGAVGSREDLACNDRDLGDKSNVNAKKPLLNEEKDNLWSKKELHLLRKYFQKSKLKNIQLAAMLQDSERQVNEWKQKFKSQRESSQVLKEKLMQVTKKHKTLKISFKAMKEDIKNYHTKLKAKRDHVKELQSERNDLSVELCNFRRELNKESFEKEKIQRLLKTKEEEMERVISDRITVLKQQYLLEITTLKKEISTLNQDLNREIEENRLNKIALEKLRMYFADLQCKSLENESASGRHNNLISVVDIDYFSA